MDYLEKRYAAMAQAVKFRKRTFNQNRVILVLALVPSSSAQMSMI